MVADHVPGYAGTSYELEKSRSRLDQLTLSTQAAKDLARRAGPDGVPCPCSSRGPPTPDYRSCPAFKRNHRLSEHPESTLGRPLIYLVDTSRLAHDATHHQAIRCDCDTIDVARHGDSSSSGSSRNSGSLKSTWLSLSWAPPSLVSPPVCSP